MPATRVMDRVRIETASGGFENFQSVELVLDLLDVSTATINVGDDGSWSDIERIVAPGEEFRIYCNGLLQMTGRAEVNEVPIDASNGTTAQIVCRTKMSDARYRSADPGTKFQGVSIKDFILALYAPLGYTAADFEFAPEADRNLMTGKKVGALDPVDLEPIKVDAAKVTPPETIFEAAEKHLKRHHMRHWDGASGKILVGKPAVSEAPLVRLICKRGSDGAGNNVESAKRIRDWSELSSELWVYGNTPGRDIKKASLKGVAVDLDAAAVFARTGHFNRVTIIPSDGAKTQAMVNAAAKREMSARSQRKNAWEVRTDGWTYWNGQESIPFATNIMADMDVATAEGQAQGAFLITRLARSLDADSGPMSSIALVHPDAMEL